MRQNKYKKGGYFLMNEKKKKVIAYGTDIEKLYKEIEKKKVKTGGETIIMHLPPKNTLCLYIFHTNTK